jgi:Tfp pilus assembly protein PilW
MKIKKYLYMATAALAMAIALTLGACTEAEVEIGSTQQGLMPVLFSAGNTAVTRSASASYMPDDSRFVCSMFFHAGAKDTNDSAYVAPVSDVNMTTAWLKINNATGNAVFCDSTYKAATSTDSYGFDENAKCFYWQNRLNHIFVALTDNNKLKTQDGTDNSTTGTLKLFPNVQTQYDGKYMLAYDLTRGENDSTITQQPDPILAYETARPSGGTAEANRVKLFFKHQFAQVQVNVKGSADTSAEIDTACIEKVELLGVAETGYVPYCINADGTLPAATSLPINLDGSKYTTTIKANPYGSCFNMFVCSTPVFGYLKSFECIAFGTLQGIRITWRETKDTNSKEHVTTFKGVTNKKLESGTKYIYNIELRRSLIADVTAKILPWDMDKTDDYSADGTISDEN